MKKKSNKCKKYRQFELFLARMAGKACRVLHLTSPTIPSYQIDLDGSPIIKSKSNSWVRNMINTMACQGLLGFPSNRDSTSFFDDGYLTFRDTSGTISTSTSSRSCACLSAIAQDCYGSSNWDAGSLYGIVVGSSNSTENFNDYTLGNIIPHGTSTGQLDRGVQSVSSKAWDSDKRKWVISLSRIFENATDSDIEVKEIGFYTSGIYTSNSSSTVISSSVMLIRDVLPSTVIVPIGKSLTVTYTVEYCF